MKISYMICAEVSGTLDETLNVNPKAPPTIAEVIDALDKLAFVAETVAHMRGMERQILPHSDKAREIIARLQSY
jgi:hypothetical protein